MSRIVMHLRIVIAVAFAVGVPMRSTAAPGFTAVVSGYLTGGCYFLSFPVYSPSVEWVIGSMTSTRPTWADDIQTIGSGDGQTVFAIVRTTTGRGLRIAQIELDQTAINNTRREFFVGLPEHYAGNAIAVAKNGGVFALVSPAQGQPVDHGIAVISPSGILERVIAITGYVGKLAVAVDSCTIFYTDGDVIRRVNACTGAPLPVFAPIGEPITGLVALSNGDVLVTTMHQLRRFTSTGALAQAYSVQDMDRGELDAVAVSSDESVLAIAGMRGCADRGYIIALSVVDGRELWRRETSYISTATGLVLGPLPAAIPTLYPTGLIVLATVLAAFAVSAIRH